MVRGSSSTKWYSDVLGAQSTSDGDTGNDLIKFRFLCLTFYCMNNYFAISAKITCYQLVTLCYRVLSYTYLQTIGCSCYLQHVAVKSTLGLAIEETTRATQRLLPHFLIGREPHNPPIIDKQIRSAVLVFIKWRPPTTPGCCRGRRVEIGSITGNN